MARAHVVFQTRFSFYGQSGWKSAAAADPGKLFDPARLDERFRYFERITLPSLAAQTDPDFTHMVLSSTLMPDGHQTRLRELVKDTLGDARAKVMFRPEGSAGQYIRTAMAKGWGGELAAQVVLDDDDALSNDFVATLRPQAQAAMEDPANEADYVFLSFPRGFTLGIEAGKPSWLERRYVPYTNLGLALVSRADGKRNPFMTSHKRVGERHPSVMVTHMRPYYLRAVHDHNDSNAVQQRTPLKPGDMAAALRYFPWLSKWFSAEDPKDVMTPQKARADRAARRAEKADKADKVAAQ